MNSSRKVVRAQDVMTDEFAIIDGLITVKEALQIFKERGAKVLIIDKRHEDDEYGLLLLSDIAKNVVAKDRSPERVNVYEVMAKPLISVDPQMDIRYCARLFESFGLAHAPVIEADKVLGVVNYHNIVLKGLLEN
ncbi:MULTISPECIES: CBS domain-containing protein [unclassified Neptuniibacter]|uniref:CBS domain-containing protein n=1 Tax=unclassified Neptuniibacter TaxID=2630693 RepID=UPI000C4B376D|nr:MULTISPECIES: CBS domain-containing protein [unclassified Neptuniibacter]MAY41469.1 CBS domain-containing protein [Oceanospirillaceae bacterium]|tara:strand:+ start:2395 stop:2799 length:405 start_codon:yes stop_codon:yes gene_type:complete